MTSTRRRGSRWSFVLVRLGRGVPGWATAWLASVPTAAAAEGVAAVELAWTAPRGCPMREQVLAKSEQLLGGQAERAVSAEGTIRTHPDGFELVLRAEVEGVQLSRRLVAPRCDELADAAALILAMAARPQQQVPPETESSSSPTHASGARAARTTPSKRTVPLRSPVAPPAASAPAAPRPPPTRPYAMVTGSVDHGTLPSSSLALGGGVGVWRGPWGAEGQVRHWLKRQRDDTNNPGKGVVLWLNAGSFLGCVAGPLGTAACGGLEVGSLSGRGYGVDEPRPRSVIWAAGLASARLRLVPARWLWLAASVEAAVPIKRYEFRLERVGSVYGPSDICLRAGLQAGAVFGSRN